jgi:hypothetical protein
MTQNAAPACVTLVSFRETTAVMSTEAERLRELRGAL